MSTVIELQGAHRPDCPEKRTESYEAFRPSGERVTVVRCIDCGAHDVHDGGLSDVSARTRPKGKRS